MNELLYFAYGTDLDSSRLEERIGNVDPVGVAKVRGYTLEEFEPQHGRSPEPSLLMTGRGSDCVLGVAYSITQDQLKDLMQTQSGYRPSAVTLELNQQIVAAATFVSTHQQAVLSVAQQRRSSVTALRSVNS